MQFLTSETMALSSVTCCSRIWEQKMRFSVTEKQTKSSSRHCSSSSAIDHEAMRGTSSRGWSAAKARASSLWAKCGADCACALHGRIAAMAASTSAGETWAFLDWAKALQEDPGSQNNQVVREKLPSYFEVFGVDPKSYQVNLKVLESRYRTLQTYLHPDKLRAKGGEDLLELGETCSAHVNEAYGTLRSPLSRASYMLQQRGMATEEGSKLDDLEFLSFVMETRERIEGDLTAQELCEVEREIGEKIEESVSEIGRLLREDDLMGAREITEKLKYYENIKNEIVRQK